MSDTTPNPAAPRGLCVRCNYPLSGLSANKCPECGRAFDPADVGTMNMGPPVGRVKRFLLRPTGWVMITLALAATGTMLWVTGWPRVIAAMNSVELEYLLSPARWKLWWATPATAAPPTERIFSPTQIATVACLLLWAMLVLIAALRWLVRLYVLLRHGKCFEAIKTRRWRLLVLPTLAVVMFFLTAFCWKQRVGWELVNRQLAGWEEVPEGDPRWVQYAMWRPPMYELRPEDGFAAWFTCSSTARSDSAPPRST